MSRRDEEKDDESSVSTVHDSILDLQQRQRAVDERQQEQQQQQLETDTSTATMNDDDNLSNDEEQLRQRPPATDTAVVPEVAATTNDKDQRIIDEGNYIDKSSSNSISHRIQHFFHDGKAVAVFFMITGGMAVAVQSGTNGSMRVIAGRSFSATANFVIGLMANLLAFAFDVLVLKTPRPRFSRLKESPWYSWIGGILGTYYVIINIFTVINMGAGTVLSVNVCSQIIMACIMDHFGLTGIAKRRITIWRILACLGLIGCVAVITIF
ncbi:hypothetical protein BDB00DRAFT_932229 [Zychaea mexicana]|uniref:uncharacterized protein n=1 Tax=Zychaea mexicana TaxID=64656 RepID=UPI0022FED3CB|nr:uncharacterized protein BDB00DRAFT_932229 [Zychaea mexicana]KAI9489105.1 hypothetical protein BDB00DRAFT_932229 [Zychaea mexicana]